MQKLIDGLHQFQRNVVANDKEFFSRLADGQKPEVLFITCSDSRVNPNLITQTKPGELFIIRNAGNIVPPHGSPVGGEAATIEYAVTALGVKEIIICGHSHCGAMNALLKPQSLDSLPLVRSFLGHAEATRRIIVENYKHLEGDALAMATVQENTLVQLENLRTQPAVAALLVKGALRLHAWVYKIDTGEVFGYDAESHSFRPVSATDQGIGGRPSIAI